VMVMVMVVVVVVVLYLRMFSNCWQNTVSEQ